MVCVVFAMLFEYDFRKGDQETLQQVEREAHAAMRLRARVAVVLWRSLITIMIIL